MRFSYCSRCVMPSTRPDTEFVGDVCTACLNYEARKNIDWDDRLVKLKELLAWARGGAYDVVVPSSGGKDSTAQVVKLQELGARVLAVTASTCHLTEVGRRNIDNLSRLVPTIEVTPNRAVRAKLNRIGLQEVGDISWPEHVAIFTIPFNIAHRFGVPLIMYGECPQREYGGPLGTEEALRMDKRWVTEFGGQLGLRPRDVIGMDDITGQDMHEYQFDYDETHHAYSPDLVTAHWLGQYVPWNSVANGRVAHAHGMEIEYPTDHAVWQFENLDNAQTGVHDYFGFLKYGYGRASAQLSVMVRMGMLDRDEAIKRAMEKEGHFPEEYMGVYLHEVLHRIGMTRGMFIDCCNRFMNCELFEQTCVTWGDRLTMQGWRQWA